MQLSRGGSVRIRLIIAAMCIGAPCYSMPPECNLREFPDFWADAQERVTKLGSLLETAERGSSYSQASAAQFRQSVKVCEAKRKSVFNDKSGNGGTVSQAKCEALLICSRIAVLEQKF